jgi:putative ABC transport system ATP-binding protein
LPEPWTEPPLLLADEPTGNLDTATSQDLMELIVSIRRERRLTIVMVTHEPDIAAYADRVLNFVDGRVVKDGPPQRVLA